MEKSGGGGAAVTVKATPLLACPPTWTFTFPVMAPAGTETVMLVALHALAAPAGTPAKVTTLFAWVAPKLLPVIVTAVPTPPEVGFRFEITGTGFRLYGYTSWTRSSSPFTPESSRNTLTCRMAAPGKPHTVMSVGMLMLPEVALVARLLEFREQLWVAGLVSG